MWLISGLATLAPAEPARVSVMELLRAFIATGANVIFSSELVPPTLEAPNLAARGDPRQRLETALEATGLALKATDAHTYVVTRAAAGRTSRGPAAAAPPRPRSVALDEISVFASRYEYTVSSGGEPAGFDQRAIDAMPGATADSLRALRGAPGLATNVSARPYVRGALLDDVLVLYDGVAIADPYHFHDFQSVLSIFSPATVGHADVYTGGFPVSYGTRSGGVIDLTPAASSGGSEYAVGASLLSYDVQTVGRADALPLDWLFAARVSSGDRVLQRVLSDTGEPSFYDALGRARWALDSSSAITWGWMLLDDKVDFNAEMPEEHAVGHSRDVGSWLRWDWQPNPTLKSHTSLTFGDTQRDNSGSLFLPGIASGSLLAHRAFSSLAVRSDVTYAPSAELRFNAGGELNHENATLSFTRQEFIAVPVAAAFNRTSNADVVSVQTPHATTAGVYGSAHRRWQDFEAEFGVRADAQDYTGFGTRAQVTPRVNLRYDLSDVWHAYASWGQFSQAQRVDEYRSELSQATPDSAGRAVHSILGLAYQSRERVTWRLEAYRHHWATISPYLDNSLGPVDLLPQLEPDRIVVVPADADAAGLEISTQYVFNPLWRAWGSYSRSTVTDDSNGREVERSWDQPHSANAGLAFTQHGAALALLLNWHSGWPKTPVSVVPASTPYLSIGARNSARWGSYFSADLRISSVVPLAFGELTLWLDGTNLTNRRNYCCETLQGMASDSTVADVRDTQWTPRVVNVGFSFRVRRPGTGR